MSKETHFAADADTGEILGAVQVDEKPGSSSLLFCPCCGEGLRIYPHHVDGLRRGTMHVLARDCGGCGQVMKYKYSKFDGLNITVEGYRIQAI